MQITDLKSIDNNAETLFAISAHEPVLLKRQGDDAARVVVDYEVFKQLQDLLSMMMPRQDKNLSQTKTLYDACMQNHNFGDADFDDIDFDELNQSFPQEQIFEFDK
ncbi:hypothetical protein [Moraxella sp. VT-16-12]|uniref:hypothetical protein n=1 Tax=Moraxella sp. VT-16-12 TaxID=2014877 RepID=UPI000B7CE3B9|nr:hypothetical protein [Moraxella sp. VT-16-12]TWV84088.1 hypothetical protein CEW93_002855 [Moraxella sp. VT-16-12]